MDHKEINPKQLWALVKMVLQEEPSMSDAEWKARCLDRIATWGFEEPEGDRLSRAMASVEHDLRATLGPRLIQLAATSAAPYQPVDIPKEKRTRTPAGWGVVVEVMAALGRSRASTPSSTAPSEPRETLELTEVEALNLFWRRCQDETTDRVALLRAFAEIAIVRPADWDPVAVREAAGQHNLHARHCFACRNADTKWSWHHVIQIQFGGSNYIRNRVALCERCHSQVHPWLPEEPRSIDDWVPISDCVPAGVAEQIQRVKR